jgi:hypothetical protein
MMTRRGGYSRDGPVGYGPRGIVEEDAEILVTLMRFGTLMWNKKIVRVVQILLHAVYKAICCS